MSTQTPKELLESGIYNFTDEGNGWVYMEIPKEHIEKIFLDAGVVPTNPDGEKDFSFCAGDIQFSFNEDGELEEILAFPVYEDEEEGFINGEDFVNAPESFWDLEEMARAELSSLDMEK